MPASSIATALPQDEHAGFYRHSLSLVAALLSYLKARLELAGIEGKEAGAQYGIAVALVAGALIILFLGYMFLCLGIVFLIAWALGDGHSWIWVTLGMGVLHLLGAGLLVFLAKNRFASPVFAATLQEFRKDQEWLNSKSTNPR